jgi:hypothetical protein
VLVGSFKYVPSPTITVMEHQDLSGEVEVRVMAKTSGAAIQDFIRFFGPLRVQQELNRGFRDELASRGSASLQDEMIDATAIKKVLMDLHDPIDLELVEMLAKSNIPIRRADVARDLGTGTKKISSSKKRINNAFSDHGMGELISSERVRVKGGWARNYIIKRARLRDLILEASKTLPAEGPGNGQMG